MTAPVAGQSVRVWRTAESTESCPALISTVHGERVVSIDGFTETGAPLELPGIPFRQPGDAVPEYPYCEAAT